MSKENSVFRQLEDNSSDDSHSFQSDIEFKMQVQYRFFFFFFFLQLNQMKILIPEMKLFLTKHGNTLPLQII